MFGKITSIFFRGMMAILPISLSIYFIVWFLTFLEGTFNKYVLNYIPLGVDIPGLGVVTGLVLVFALGTLLSNSFFSKIFSFVQLPFKNIPLVKSIYSALEDLMSYFAQGDGNKASKVVKVKLPNLESEIIGLLTVNDPKKIQGVDFSEESVAVFIPMSYALGGYTVFVPRKNITETNLKVEDAMKSALTAWMKK